jgi:hypothetical protein
MELRLTETSGTRLKQSPAMWAALRTVRLIQLSHQPWREFAFARLADIAGDGGHRLQITPGQRIVLRKYGAGNLPAGSLNPFLQVIESRFLDIRAGQRQSLVQKIQFLQPQEELKVAVHGCTGRFEEVALTGRPPEFSTLAVGAGSLSVLPTRSWSELSPFNIRKALIEVL